MDINNEIHPYRLIFAQNMRKIRRLKEISQEALAFEAQVSRAYICEVERGNSAVSIDVMGRIADALELPLEHLLSKNAISHVEG